MRSATVTTVLQAPQSAVFEYMADIEHLPEWATEFARELRRDGDDYKVVNGLGEFYFTIHADPARGVIDTAEANARIIETRLAAGRRGMYRLSTRLPARGRSSQAPIPAISAARRATRHVRHRQ